MDLLDITQCKRDLNFYPCEGPKDSLPSIAWNRYLVTGFDRAEGTVINLVAPLPNLLHDCYPRLSLPEIARLLETLKKLEHDYWIIDVDEVLRKYSLVNHPELHEMFSLILLLPLELQNWISEKLFMPKELYPLRSILKRSPETKTGFMFDLFSGLRSRKASRSQAARIIDLSVELFLNDYDIWPKQGTSLETWCSDLEKMKTPQSAGPSSVQTRWIQDEGLTGVAVKFNIQSSDDVSSPLQDSILTKH